MVPRGGMPFGMMGGLAEMIASMMENESTGMSGISIDPDMMDEYPRWIQDSVHRGEGTVKKERNAQEIIDKITLKVAKKHLEEITQMLYGTLLRVEGLKERLAEKDAAIAEAEKQRREQIAGLNKELRAARQLTVVKANAHKVRLKVVQALRTENKSLKAVVAGKDQEIADLSVVVTLARNLREVINGINVQGTKPELQETINTLKLAVADISLVAGGGNGADAEAVPAEEGFISGKVSADPAEETVGAGA